MRLSTLAYRHLGSANIYVLDARDFGLRRTLSVRAGLKPLRRINELAAEHALERRQRYLGRLEEVLVEKRNERHPAQVKGRNRQGCPVFFDGDAGEPAGQPVPLVARLLVACSS